MDESLGKDVYEDKIRALQESVFSLRLSRGVLLDLLHQSQIQQKKETETLRRQNAGLKKQVGDYARQLWEKNKRICELEKHVKS
ncbi:MAG: hypothetical protein K6B40_06765 [Firmicutes bacterium]|nr:hypothetical protein [Bacillota bacterium]